MGVVEIKGKKYGVGYEWYVGSDEKEAKEKAKLLRRKGFLANVVRVGKNIYQVYACERADEGAKYQPLAMGFLNLAGGYYYMNLENGKVWVLIKTADGSIVHENVYDSTESFENKNYNLLYSSIEEGQEKREITIQQASFHQSGFSLNLPATPKVSKKVLLLIPFLVGLLIALFFLTRPVGVPEVKNPIEAIPPPQVPQTPLPEGENVPSSPPPEPLKAGRLDLSCYEEFYSKALSEGKGSCEWSLSPVEPVKEADLPPCGEALNSLKIFGVQVQWGQVEDYGDFTGYSFSLSGPIYAYDLREMEKQYFASLNLKIEGEVRNISTTLSGVLLCRKIQ